MHLEVVVRGDPSTLHDTVYPYLGIGEASSGSLDLGDASQFAEAVSIFCADKGRGAGA